MSIIKRKKIRATVIACIAAIWSVVLFFSAAAHASEENTDMEAAQVEASGSETDPVLEQYILDHAKSEYAGDGDSLTLVNALLVKQTYFDAELVEDGDTLDSIMGLIENGGDGQEEALDKYIMQTGDYTAVYECGEDSGYYVAYADTMQDSENSETREAVFAMNDTGANILYDCIYDGETGLVYLPKEYFEDESGEGWFLPVQVQFMQVLDPQCDTTEVSFSVGNGEEIVSTDTAAVSLYDTDLTLQTDAGLEEDSISVYVNGAPISEDSYVYDSESGDLVIYAYPSGVENVYVDAGRDGVLGGIARAAGEWLGKAVSTEAWAVSYSEMTYFDTGVDVSSVNVGDVYTGTAGVIYSSKSAAASNVYGAYLTDSEINALQSAIYNGTSIDLSTVYDLANSNQLTTRVYLNKGATATIAGKTYSPISSVFTPFSGVSRAMALECSHVNAFGITNSGAQENQLYTNKLVRVRCLYKGVDSNGYEYAVFGIVTQTINTQSGTAIFKVRGDTSEETPVLSTAYYKARQAYLPSLDLYISKEDCTTGDSLEGAKFAIYMDGSKVGTVTTDEEGLAVYHWTGDVLYTSYSTYSQKFCANYNRISAEDKAKYSSVESSRSTAYSYAKSQVTSALSAKLATLKTTTHTWTVKEIEAPENYFIHEDVFEQEITVGTTAIEITFSDEPYGYANLAKKSADQGITDGNSCYSLADAVYGVYSSLADAKKDTDRVATLTTEEDGNSNTVKLRTGVYYVKEISASPGYSPDTTVYEVTVEKEQTATIQSEEPPDYDQKGLSLTKIQEDTDYNVGRSTSFLSYLNEYLQDMSGAQFTIKYYDGQYSDLDELDPSHLQKTWVVQTKARCGECDSLFDDRDSCILHMQSKHGITDEYDIAYVAALEDAFLVSGSDSLYYDASGLPVLPLGTITVEETRFPWGYLTDGPYVAADGSYEVDEDGVILMNVNSDHAADETADEGGGQLTLQNMAGNEITKIEQLRRCSITIHKKDDYGDDCEGVEYSVAILNEDTGEYEYIASYNGTASAPNTDGLSYTNEDGVIVTATDSEGLVVFNNLVFGTYLVTETKTVEGASLLANSFTVELPYAADSTRDSSTEYDYYDEETGMYYWVNLTYEVSDGTIFQMPQAGGEKGIAATAAAGGCLIILGCLYSRRRKKEHELRL